ncbi:MAG: hypothetical protein CVU48_01145 [Candidatus Cloacimonetes bacterium HGW-Cloacimonetes-1]|jgi:hypothetical protein|nr:MAG: hypothetical protein CVU48_01145 [Candidatus Cloacimonetes bacterium HGW-Cloacimonetes-1]
MNESGEKEFSGVTDPQNAGKDLNNITDLMKKHYLRGFDTLEIEVSKDFLEHYQEQFELIKSYCPYHLELSVAGDTVSLISHYKEAKAYITPLKWKVSQVDKDDDDLDMGEVITPFLKGIESFINKLDNSKALHKENLKDVLLEGYEQGLAFLEVEITTDEYDKHDEYLEELAEQIAYVEALTTEDLDETTLLCYEYVAPEDAYSEDDIPDYIQWFSLPETCEDTDLDKVNGLIDSAEQNEVKELSIKIDTRRYERIKRKLKSSNADRSCKVIFNALDHEDHTDLKVTLIEV